MIVDAHVHSGTFDGSRAMASSELVEMLAGLGVDKGLVSTSSGLRSSCKDSRADNDRLARFVGLHSEQLRAFCTVNPMDGEAAVSELRRCVEVHGMIGLKLHPWLQGFSVSDDYINPLVEECIDRKVPILFHDGTPPYCTPLQIGFLAGRYPESTVLLGHSGLNDLWRNAIQAAKRFPNVLLCACGPPMHAIYEMAVQVGSDRMMFGSDVGAAAEPGLVAYRKEKIEKLPIPAEDQAKILGETARRWFNL